MKPIPPMLAVPSTGQSNRRPILLTELASRKDWVAEEKLDGIRAILYAEGGLNRLYNRNGKEITEKFPELHNLRLPGSLVLDGELVARDGLFSTVATRDKQTGGFKMAAKANPCYFVAFDLLMAGGNSLMEQPLRTRHLLMRNVIGRRRNIRPIKQSGAILDLWQQVVSDGGEGIICKMRNGIYLPGKRAESWVKFKTVRSLTAIALGYAKEARKGLAIELAVMGYDGPVPIGRVGTGWDSRQEDQLRGRLDNGEMFPVEIHALNRTFDNKLRMAVFKGERTDLPLTAATVDQLLALPVY